MKRLTAVLAICLMLLATLLGCKAQKIGGSPVAAPPQPVTIGEDDGNHELTGFGRFRYGKEMTPSARFVQCKWKLQRLQNRTWVTIISGGFGHTAYAERDPKNRPVRLVSKSCGRWY